MGSSNILEMENTRLKRVQRLFGVFVLAMGVIVVLAAASFLKAVEVTDANGTLRCVLHADDGKNKSGLEIRDPNGNVCFAVRTNLNDDAWIEFFDKNGKNRIELGIAVNEDAHLSIYDGAGNVRHRLIAAP